MGSNPAVNPKPKRPLAFLHESRRAHVAGPEAGRGRKVARALPERRGVELALPARVAEQGDIPVAIVGPPRVNASVLARFELEMM